MKRKKIRIIMAGIFCVGVLMGGLGTGIAFAEFSRFTYHPVKTSSEAFHTEKFTYTMPQEDGEKIWIRRYFGEAIVKLTEQEDIPRGQMDIYITYNTEACTVEYTDYFDADNEVHLQFYMDSGNDFENFMKYKDDFLEGLRNRELRDYQIEHIQSMEIRVNPEDKERIGWK